MNAQEVMLHVARMTLLPAFAMGLALILTACATTTGSVGTEPTFCETYQPVAWSTQDTDYTILQTKQNNARYVALGCVRD